MLRNISEQSLTLLPSLRDPLQHPFSILGKGRYLAVARDFPFISVAGGPGLPSALSCAIPDAATLKGKLIKAVKGDPGAASNILIVAGPLSPELC